MILRRCNRTYKAILKIIPWYVNGTLSEEEQFDVEESINHDPQLGSALLEWEEIARVSKSQPVYHPKNDIEKQLLTRIGKTSVLPRWSLHRYALFFAIFILCALWLVVRPGIVLNWSSQSDLVNVYRVYRTVNNSEGRKLIYEIQSKDLNSDYSYIDSALFPWRSYSYVVEGIYQGEEGEFSLTLSRSAIGVLPIQLTLVGISILFGYQVSWVLLVHSNRHRMYLNHTLA